MGNKTGSVLDQLTGEYANRSRTDPLVEGAGRDRAAATVAEMTTPELFRLRLHQHIHRLTQLVALQAPPLVLVSAILLVKDTAEGAYPDEVALILTQRMRARAKERLGRCAFDLCEDPASADPGFLGYCTVHFKQVESEMT